MSLSDTAASPTTDDSVTTVARVDRGALKTEPGLAADAADGMRAVAGIRKLAELTGSDPRIDGAAWLAMRVAALCPDVELTVGADDDLGAIDALSDMAGARRPVEGVAGDGPVIGIGDAGGMILTLTPAYGTEVSSEIAASFEHLSRVVLTPDGAGAEALDDAFTKRRAWPFDDRALAVQGYAWREIAAARSLWRIGEDGAQRTTLIATRGADRTAALSLVIAAHLETGTTRVVLATKDLGGFVDVMETLSRPIRIVRDLAGDHPAESATVLWLDAESMRRTDVREKLAEWMGEKPTVLVTDVTDPDAGELATWVRTVRPTDPLYDVVDESNTGSFDQMTSPAVTLPTGRWTGSTVSIVGASGPNASEDALVSLANETIKVVDALVASRRRASGGKGPVLLEDIGISSHAVWAPGTNVAALVRSLAIGALEAAARASALVDATRDAHQGHVLWHDADPAPGARWSSLSNDVAGSPEAPLRDAVETIASSLRGNEAGLPAEALGPMTERVEALLAAWRGQPACPSSGTVVEGVSNGEADGVWSGVSDRPAAPWTARRPMRPDRRVLLVEASSSIDAVLGLVEGTGTVAGEVRIVTTSCPGDRIAGTALAWALVQRGATLDASSRLAGIAASAVCGDGVRDIVAATAEAMGASDAATMSVLGPWSKRLPETSDEAWKVLRRLPLAPTATRAAFSERLESALGRLGDGSRSSPMPITITRTEVLVSGAGGRGHVALHAVAEGDDLVATGDLARVMSAVDDLTEERFVDGAGREFAGCLVDRAALSALRDRFLG